MFAGNPLAPEALVEDKGLSLSLHFRLARQRQAVQAWLQSCIDRLAPAPRVIGGKLIYNLLPPGSLNTATNFGDCQRCAVRQRAPNPSSRTERHWPRTWIAA